MSDNAIVKDNGREITLSVPEPFDFGQNLVYLARSPNECLYRIDGDRLYKAIPIDSGETPVVEIRSDSASTMTIRFLGDTEPSGQAGRDAVIRYVRDWFDLDTDLAPFYRLAASDPLLGPAAELFNGLRCMGIPDLFEAMSWGIIGQQINLAFAYTLKRRLVETFGPRIECEGETYYLFPSAERIARLEPEELDELRMTARKNEYLVGVARLIAGGSLTKANLLALGNLRAAEKALVGIRGIGPWTANYVLMRCLRMTEAFPIDDVGLHQAIRHAAGMDRKPTRAELLAMAAGWAGWEAYATFYLWRHLY
ncbi:DNA-3-methyladenine glycosylase 2 [Cohnella zeiphila]|uniref:DNA-3-methyladenine glycosylase II n=1 Tax=Cohnella zeiphila TaxID=2761120 RepID=A0A7X0VZL3_9BACL|nr:DNA-3-methyladenine glycosylase [Cohnella zeiphila]MBB6735667.1 DNA-3-methyladenine glycosylase 2 family protein [Cohnella zeiphila]